MTLYIAYGSNLDTCQMKYRCPGAKPVAKGFLKNHKLVFQGSMFNAHANVVRAKGKSVPIVIWNISDQNERSLDRYEGVKGGYYRKENRIVDIRGERKKALIYIMNENPYGIPADRYLETIQFGYNDFNLPIKYLDEAVNDAYSKTRLQEVA